MYKYHNDQTVHFQSVTLLTKNLNKQIEFYKEVLGFTLLSSTNENAVFSTDGKNPILELVTNDQVKDVKNTQGLYHIAYLFPNERALSRILRRLVQYKYPLTGASDHGVSHALYLDDPEDNGIELYFDLDDTLWPRKNGKIDMYTHGVDAQALYDLTEGEAISPIDKDVIIGHLHFHVQTLGSAQRFYRDIIGLDLIQNFFGQALFLSDSGYHHHLGLNIWNPGAPLRALDVPGLESYTVSMPKAKYDALLARLKENNITLDETTKLPSVTDILNQTIYFDVK